VPGFVVVVVVELLFELVVDVVTGSCGVVVAGLGRVHAANATTQHRSGSAFKPISLTPGPGHCTVIETPSLFSPYVLS
jgi:hypothetical protein